MADHELQIRGVPAGEPPASDLLAAVETELQTLYGFTVTANTPSATPRDFSAPGGRFLVLYRELRAIGCGGVKPIGSGVAEIKRMYVVPDERSRGHARRLLVALEDAARDLGHALVRLDTGPKQPHARALYATAGYREIPDYNGNVYASVWFEKEL